MKISRHGILFVISAPSGAGKTTVVQALRKTGNFFYSVSCTTRAPRSGETDGHCDSQAASGTSQPAHAARRCDQWGRSSGRSSSAPRSAGALVGCLASASRHGRRLTLDACAPVFSATSRIQIGRPFASAAGQRSVRWWPEITRRDALSPSCSAMWPVRHGWASGSTQRRFAAC